MDRRRIELQIDAILVPFRIERTRRDHRTMVAFRARARMLLDGIADDARHFPDLDARLAGAREELDSTENF